MHFDVSSTNFNRTIADYDGSWTLLHRGIDSKTYELRLLYKNQRGQVRDVATSKKFVSAIPTFSDELILKTGHDYYLALVMGRENVTLWAADLSSQSALQSFRVSRSGADRRFDKLGRPKPGTRFKIGNSDGSGRVVGLIDEVRYSRTALSAEQIASASGAPAGTATQIAKAALHAAKRKREVLTAREPTLKAVYDVAVAALAFVRARNEADRVVHGLLSPAPTSAERKAAKRKADSAQHEHSFAAQRLLLANARAELAMEKMAGRPDSKKSKQARKSVAAVKSKIAVLQQTTNPPAYPPLGPQYPKTSTGRRRALANWIADRQNPLTARVAVNHIWSRHFGRPLVASVFDFGRSGELPTHPKLLDWLAVELMEHNWSMKHLHRLIVTSGSYRLSSRPGSIRHPNFQRDKDNTLLWKFERRRLEAETVRDSMLKVAGQLDLKMGGPEIEPSQGAVSRRRSMYFAIYPEAGGAMRFLSVFDPPDPTDCYRRAESIVPQQALAMSNSLLAINQGRLLAGTITSGLADDDDDARFVRIAFEQILSRAPNTEEQRLCVAFLDKQRVLLRSQKLSAKRQTGAVQPSSDPRRRARESLVRTLFNHNDFVTVH